MATQKQMEAIKKLSGIAGIEYKEADIAPLNNGDLDKVFDRLRVELNNKKATQKTEKTEQKSEINYIRFGLCCKLVIRESSIDFWLQEPAKFIDKAKSLYYLITEAEKQLSASLKPSTSSDKHLKFTKHLDEQGNVIMDAETRKAMYEEQRYDSSIRAGVN